MVAVALSLVFWLVGAPALALSGDVAASASSRLAAQQAEGAIEEELALYLEDDDIAGAAAFVADLAVRGVIGEGERRALEDQIARTRTERTLNYSRKIREAIRASDLDAMRAYNARLQRLSATAPVPAEPVEARDESAAADAVSEEIVSPDTDVIADLVRRGEAAIEAYNLSIAGPGKDSALSMVEALRALGAGGEAAARNLGRKTMAVYEALIGRNIDRGRLDKAATFAGRMGEVAARAGLPRDEADALAAEVDRARAGRQQHARLMQEAASLRDRGRLVAPIGGHALAVAAEALRLGVDPEAARALVDDIVERQRARADGMVAVGRFRDAAQEMNGLGDALVAAEVGDAALVAEVRAAASALHRHADFREGDRARDAAAAEP